MDLVSSKPRGNIVTDDALERDGYVDLRRVIARLWWGRWVIVWFVLVLAALFSAAAFLMTPVYRAKTVVVSAGSDRSGSGVANSVLAQIGGLAALAGAGSAIGSTVVDEALAVLRSREFTERFIRAEHLLPELFHDRWNAANSRWRADKDPPTWGEAYRKFDEKVRTITFERKTGLITVQIDWRDPELAAAWSVGLIERANAEMRERAITRSSASVAYLEKELERTSAVDTRATINRLLEAQINQRMLANVTREYSFRIVDRALPPDRDDLVRPRKGLMFVLGPLVGLLFGAAVVLIWPASLLRRGN